MSHVRPNPARVKFTRAWQDLAPKLLAFLGGGTAATVIIQIAGYLGLTIDTGLANVIVVVTGSILGYVVKDSVPVDAVQASAKTD